MAEDFNIGRMKAEAMAKAFGVDLEKGRVGVYEDNAENRRLNRVGQPYGHKKEEEASKGKQSAGQQKQGDLADHAKNASDEALKRASQDPKASPEVKAAAEAEMKKRGEAQSDENKKKGVEKRNEWKNYQKYEKSLHEIDDNADRIMNLLLEKYGHVPQESESKEDFNQWKEAEEFHQKLRSGAYIKDPESGLSHSDKFEKYIIENGSLAGEKPESVDNKTWIKVQSLFEETKSKLEDFYYDLDNPEEEDAEEIFKIWKKGKNPKYSEKLEELLGDSWSDIDSVFANKFKNVIQECLEAEGLA